jgi:predicted DNA-binding transcriptional regulator YafY
MAKRSPFVRYKFILERLQAARKPSIKEILRYLDDNNHPIMAREFKRDLDAISRDFNIDVLYNRRGNYYYIDPEYSSGLASALTYLEMAQTADIIVESFRDIKALQSFVIFDQTSLGKGVEHLPLLIDAIKSELVVSVWHSTFQDEVEKCYSFSPRLLKQYQGRWYVVGAVDGITNPMVFGLDRIHHVKIELEVPKVGPLDLSGFDEIVGVSLPEGELVEVRFEATPLQAKYLEALPLHRSQRVIARRPDSVEFMLLVRPNYELRQEFLKLGESVHVLSPETLVQEIQEIYKKCL